ncbi:protein unc-80 homolog [Photinus pyralis]|uniref:protein unc-80 homolog n=1 Tax=Photinus pyralis TaxID=7054 RepID=UPI00126715CF|nr:protein unc-80 homolog [Photinus pyralis]XP_031332001.1 protein unc-80 homolog [Photinus pyralis]
MSHVSDRSQQSSISDEHGIQKTDSQHKAHKLRFVSSVELRHSSGETSTTPLSPGSPADDSSGELHPNKPRLQRVKVQSRKTFRLRKSRKSRIEVSHINIEPEEIPAVTTPSQTTSPTTILSEQTPAELSVTSIPQQVFEPNKLRISFRSKPTEGSWDEDSAISHTSSTSGYRESYPVMQLKESLDSSPKPCPPLASPDIHDLPSTSSAATNYIHGDNSSPDCSLNENGERTALLSPTERSSSQHSLLMIFDSQDETTLI